MLITLRWDDDFRGKVAERRVPAEGHTRETGGTRGAGVECMQTCMCFDDDKCAGVCMRAASVLFEQSILLRLGSITINNILLIIFPVLLISFFSRAEGADPDFLGPFNSGRASCVFLLVN